MGDKIKRGMQLTDDSR